MGCPSTPLSCLEPSNIFAGVYDPNCGGFVDPSNFQAEQAIFDNGFREQIQNYGVEINYYVNTFNLEEMNFLYGEDTTQEYLGPIVIKSYIEMENIGPVYTLAGFDAGDTITAHVHISTFTSLFSSLSVFTDRDSAIYTVEPRAQDKIEVSPLGCNRPGGRGVKIFEVTEVLDQDVASINPAMGTYIWRIKAVRNEYNNETNEPKENVNNQVYDNTFSGKLSSSLYPSLTSDSKLYDSNSDTFVKNDVFPESTSGNSGSVYGDYY